MINQSGHKRCRRRLDMGGQTSLPQICMYFSEIFSPSHIKLINNNLSKDFKSGDRRDRKIFSG